MKKFIAKINWANVPSATYIFTVCFILFGLLNREFLTVYNLSNILVQSSILMIVGLGVVIIIISGGMDLSVGSLLTLSGCISGSLLHSGFPLGIAVLCGIFSGVLCGFGNGIMVTKLRIPPFIATLAMMNIAAGLSNTVSERKTIYWDPNPILQFIGNNDLLGVPVFFIIAVIIAIIIIYLFKKSILGIYIYAIGGNEEVPRLSGINIVKWKLIFYSISGLLAGIAGILMNSRVGCADPTVGVGYEFDAAVAAIIGGNILKSGKGNLLGGILGAITLILIKNGLNLIGLETHWQLVIIGSILMLGMIINDVVGKRLANRSHTSLRMTDAGRIS